MARPKTTDPPPEDFVEYGELVLAGIACAKAAATVWPQLSAPEAKATKVNKDPRFRAWKQAQKEFDEDRARHITAALGCDYESRIIRLCEAFNDPEVKMRERLQIHDKLTTAEGRKTTSKESGSGDNALAGLVAQSAGFGAAVGASLSDRRLPAVRGKLPEDTGQARTTGALPPLASSSPNVGGPQVAKD